MKPGDSTTQLVSGLLDAGASHIALLIRHSAREFEPGRHDLLNPLTDEGRMLAREMGRDLPKSLTMRAYSSPAERCIETGDLILAGHEQAGGPVKRNRVVEALGVFYVLDQMKMYMAMRERSGIKGMITAWTAGEISHDIMMPSHVAATLLGRLIEEKLNESPGEPQLDLLVSHDFTLYLVKSMLLSQHPDAYPEVNFLDGIAFFRRGSETFVQSHHSQAVPLRLNDL